VYRFLFFTFVMTLLALIFYSANGTYVLKYACGEYRRFYNCCPLPQVIDVLTIDPNVCELAIERTSKAGPALQSVKEIAQQNGAIAAVNASFFKENPGFLGAPAHILKVNNQWYGGQTMARDGQPLARALIGWRDGGREAMIGRARTLSIVRIWENNIPRDYAIAHINQRRSKDSAVVYTSAFFDRTPNSTAGIELAIDHGMVVALYAGGNNPVPRGYDGAIYSVGPSSEEYQHALKIRLGARAQLVHHVIATDVDSTLEHPEDKRFENMDVLLGGTPVLVHNGMVSSHFALDKTVERFREVWYPRTAVGVHRDGYWIIATVRGLGMTLLELAEFMQRMQCKNAINLDGGSSTEFYLDPRMLASRAVGEKDLSGYLTPRAVPDALVVRRR
jgi:hypothetical protein